MSCTWSGGWLGSMPIIVRLRTSRRTLSRSVCKLGERRRGSAEPDCFCEFNLFTCSQRTLFECRLMRRGMRFLPKAPRDFECIDLYVLPPGDFIPGLVQLSMMTATQRHGELIAHL